MSGIREIWGLAGVGIMDDVAVSFVEGIEHCIADVDDLRSLVVVTSCRTVNDEESWELPLICRAAKP